MTNLIQSAREELRSQATPRAMIGIGVLALILVFLGLSELSGANDTLRGDVSSLQRELRIERTILDDVEIEARSEALRVQLEETQAQFWSGPTPGIIGAQLQGEIERITREAGIRNPRITVLNEPTALGEEAIMFSISVSARDRHGQFLVLFQQLARAEGLFVISDFEWSELNGRLELEIQAPAIIRDESA